MRQLREPTDNGAVILDGRRIRDEIIDDLRAKLERLGGPRICLATLVVGDDPVAMTHVGYKHTAASRAGMTSIGMTLQETATQSEVDEIVTRLNADPAIHGVFVQLPLPARIDLATTIALIKPSKDVDGLTAANWRRLISGQSGFVPCTSLGILRLLRRYKIETAGRQAVVLGRSTLVGRTTALLLAGAGATPVTMLESNRSDARDVSRTADILISDVGHPGLVTADWIRPGATVVDVGVSRIDGQVVGDVDLDSARTVAGAIMPNPGGAGPMTVACLLENTLTAARLVGAP